MSNSFSSALLPPEAQVLLQTVQDRLNEYVEKMAPGKIISNVDGAYQQKQLWQGVINFLLQQPAPIFIQGWGLLLKSVQEHRKGAFSPAYVNRFREELKLTLQERRNYERLIHLAYTTCEPRSRALTMRQVDMNQILSMLPKEDMRQKLISFYQL